MFVFTSVLVAFHNCCTIGCDQNIVRAKKFAIRFMNVRMKKCSYERKDARSEAPVGDRCAMICNRSYDMSYVLVHSLSV